MKTSIFIIGCGAVGASMGKTLYDAGAKITGVYDLNFNRAQTIAHMLDTTAFTSTLPTKITQATVVLVTVPDGEIKNVATCACDLNCCSNKQVWIHCSGRLGANALASLKSHVLGYGAMHPALVFPPGSIYSIPSGTCFAVDGDLAAEQAISQVVKLLSGTIVKIPDRQRTAYHAAMVMTSNYAVTLLSEARRVLLSSGVEPKQIEPLILNLMDSSLHAVHKLGIDAALSGPIRRGDAQAVHEHLDALASDKQTKELYIALAKATTRMVSQTTDIAVDEIKKILNPEI